MRQFKKICMGFLSLFLILAAGSRNVSAADEEYTYTVRVYAGNLGALTRSGIEVSSRSAVVRAEQNRITVSGLKYGDTVYIRPQETADVTDERYYVRGVRRSGRDNSEAEAPTFHVASDRDYVIAYGIRGDMAAYTVNYQDASGRALMESDVYYGNIGERQYVSARYIDGYQPQTLNIVKTISANETENVFTFRYTAVTAPETPAPAPAPTTTATTTTTSADGTTAGTGTGGTAGGGGGTAAGAGEEDGVAEGAADAETPDAGDVEVPDEDVPLGGDAQLPDGEVPLEQQELEDLDDEEVPLSEIKAEQAGLMGYFPVYAGIGVVAAVVLAVAGIYLYRRRKKLAVKSSGKPGKKTPGQK